MAKDIIQALRDFREAYKTAEANNVKPDTVLCYLLSKQLGQANVLWKEKDFLDKIHDVVERETARLKEHRTEKEIDISKDYDRGFEGD